MTAVAPQTTIPEDQWYVEHVLPWPQGEEDGCIIVSHTIGKGHWMDEAVRTPLEALAAIRRRGADPKTIGVFASQGRMRPHGRQKRGADLADAFAGIWLDLDAKDFGNPEESIIDRFEGMVEELKAFRRAVALPFPSVLVWSGGGMHVYWLTTTPMSKAQWTALSTGLRNAAQQHGLRADLQCTTDAARVLRVPGTQNRKPEYGEGLPVEVTYPDHGSTPVRYTLEDLAPLSEYATAPRLIAGSGNVVHLPQFPPRDPITAPSDLRAGVQLNVDEIRSAVAAIPVSAVASEGDWVRFARALAHSAYLHPAYAGELWAILDSLSQRAPGYDAADNLDRWERYIREAGNRQQPITIATVFAMARSASWRGSANPSAVTSVGNDENSAAVTSAGNGGSSAAVTSAGNAADSETVTSAGNGAGSEAVTSAGNAADSETVTSAGKGAGPEAVTSAGNGAAGNSAGSGAAPAGGNIGRLPLKGGMYDPATALNLFNANFFIAIVKGACLIAQVQDDETITYIAPKDFSVLVRNILVCTNGKVISGVSFWLRHRDRRQKTIVFRPGASVGRDEYNLWRGFGVRPAKGWSKQRRLLRHILEVICRRDKIKFKYLVKWLAWAVQHPDRHAETVVVLQSRAQGTGKTTLSQVMSDIFGVHARTINSKARLLSQFNSDFETVCWVSGEEMLWAGDKGGADALKSIITGDTLTLEIKNGPRWEISNRLHLLLTTNHVHAVSAGTNERRYFVLDVSDDKARDETWFDPLYADLEGGGKEQFLWLLQNLKLRGWHPRRLPKTAETTDQQRMSADSVIQWANACCEADAIVAPPAGMSRELGTTIETQDLLSSYTAYCRQRSLQTVDDRRFGKALTAMFGPHARKRLSPSPTRKGRPYTYDVPDGDAWRNAIDEYLGI